MMYSEIVPSEGGRTEFVDWYSAYDNQSSEWKARLESLNAVHNFDFARTRRHGREPMTEQQKSEVLPVSDLIIRVHPETGHTAIYLGDHAETIEGWDYDESRALIEQVTAKIATEDQFFTHTSSPNKCML